MYEPEQHPWLEMNGQFRAVDIAVEEEFWPLSRAIGKICVPTAQWLAFENFDRGVLSLVLDDGPSGGGMEVIAAQFGLHGSVPGGKELLERLDARLASLFPWRVPRADVGASRAWRSESSLHPAIQLGGSLETLRPVFEEGCDHLEELRYTGEMAAPFDEQTQVNCSGAEILGARREVEFLFNDGPLGHAWILIEPDDVAPVLATLEKSFGAVIYETDLDRVFASGTVALRLEPPEILVGTPDIIAALTGYRAAGR